MGRRTLAGVVAATAMAFAAGEAAAQVVVFDRAEMLAPHSAATGPLLDVDTQPSPDWIQALDTAQPFVVDPLAGPFIGWNGMPIEQQPVIHYNVGANAGVLPEPALWGMMLIGFFGAGFLLRRYKAEMMAAWPAKA